MDPTFSKNMISKIFDLAPEQRIKTYYEQLLHDTCLELGLDPKWTAWPFKLEKEPNLSVLKSDALKSRWKEWSDIYPAFLDRNPQIELYVMLACISYSGWARSWASGSECILQDWVDDGEYEPVPFIDQRNAVNPELFARLQALRAQTRGWLYDVGDKIQLLKDQELDEYRYRLGAFYRSEIERIYAPYHKFFPYYVHTRKTSSVSLPKEKQKPVDLSSKPKGRFYTNQDLGVTPVYVYSPRTTVPFEAIAEREPKDVEPDRIAKAADALKSVWLTARIPSEYDNYERWAGNTLRAALFLEKIFALIPDNERPPLEVQATEIRAWAEEVLHRDSYQGWPQPLHETSSKRRALIKNGTQAILAVEHR